MSYVSQNADITGPSLGQAWRSEEHGMVFAIVHLGGSHVTFTSAEDARQLAAACTAAADALGKLAGEA